MELEREDGARGARGITLEIPLALTLTLALNSSSSTNLFRRIAVAGLLTVPPPSNRQILSVALLALNSSNHA